jgi:hypothetical protein
MSAILKDSLLGLWIAKCECWAMLVRELLELERQPLGVVGPRNHSPSTSKRYGSPSCHGLQTAIEGVIG